MRITAEHGGDCTDGLKKAIEAGSMAAGARTACVVVTRDFDASVRQRLDNPSYTSARTGGDVVAKSLDGPTSVIILNQSAVELRQLTPLDVERTVVHEGSHLRMFRRRESARHHDDLASTPEEVAMLHLASQTIEEYRCELTTVHHRGYPAMRGCRLSDLARNLHNVNVDFVEVILASRARGAAELHERIMSLVAVPLAKMVAATAGGASPRGMERHMVSKPTPDWHDYVSPVWARRRELFSGLPPAHRNMGRTAYRDALVAGAAIEVEALRAIGFEYRRTSSGSMSFVQILSDVACADRFVRSASITRL